MLEEKLNAMNVKVPKNLKRPRRRGYDLTYFAREVAELL